MKKKLYIFGLALCLAAWLFLLVFIPPSWADEKPSARIFILHSYEQGNVCGQPQHDGILTALNKAFVPQGRRLAVKAFYMDSKGKNHTPELIERQAALATEALTKFKPHVLLTLDDNAFGSVGLKIASPSLPVVFSGLNGQPEDYNSLVPFMDSRAHPGANITGIYEKLHVAKAVKVHSKLFPGLKKVLFIVDSSPTGQAIYKQINLELAKPQAGIAHQVEIAQNWGHYQQIIFAANRDPLVGAIYPAALLLTDANGRTYSITEILSWTTKFSTKPEIAVNFMFTRLGLFGGAAVDFFAMGVQAGEKAAQIINGKQAGQLPIDNARRYALAFNLDRARSLNLTIPDDVLLAADEVVSTKH